MRTILGHNFESNQRSIDADWGETKDKTKNSQVTYKHLGKYRTIHAGSKGECPICNHS